MDGEKEQYALNLIKTYASTQTFKKKCYQIKFLISVWERWVTIWFEWHGGYAIYNHRLYNQYYS